ncbi:hypothetical protein [Acinetobacter proteolyticus]|uniref:hypothetical protein n=1 Tax=Acinetobacter proteolyticus TaxID=1776741 RepID=UPI0031D80A3E
MSILDLPLARQEQIAKEDGFINVEAWRAHVQAKLDAGKQHTGSLKQVSYYDDLSEKEKAKYRRWGSKMASSNPAK